MELFKQFVIDKYDHKITIIQNNGICFYNAQDIGNLLGFKNIRSRVKNFPDTERTTLMTDIGHMKQKRIYITYSGLLRLIASSKKELARDILKWLSDVYESIEMTGKYDLTKHQEILNEHGPEAYKTHLEEELGKLKHENNFLKTKDAVHQLSLEYRRMDANDHNKPYIELFDKKPILYLIRICYIDGKQMLKIGETDDICQRLKDHRCDYGYKDIWIHHIKECSRNRDFEQTMIHDPILADIRYHGYVKDDGTGAVELFLVDDIGLKRLIDYIELNIDNYKYSTLDKDLEIQQIKKEVIIENQKLEEIKSQSALELAKTNEKIEELRLKTIQIVQEAELEKIRALQHVKELELKLEETKNKDFNYSDNNNIINRVLASSKTDRDYNGTKIQMYSHDGLTLIKTFDKYEDIDNCSLVSRAKPGTIRRSAQENTLYKNYRWMLLSRDMPDDTIQKLPPLVTKKCTKKDDFIVIFSQDGKNIYKVFSDPTAVAEAFGTTSGAVVNRLKDGEPYKKHPIEYWTDCDDIHKAAFLKTSKLPDIPIGAGNKPVDQFGLDGKFIITFPSIAHIEKIYKVGRDGIKKAIAGTTPYEGRLWSYSKATHVSYIFRDPNYKNIIRNAPSLSIYSTNIPSASQLNLTNIIPIVNPIIENTNNISNINSTITDAVTNNADLSQNTNGQCCKFIVLIDTAKTAIQTIYSSAEDVVKAGWYLTIKGVYTAIKKGTSFSDNKMLMWYDDCDQQLKNAYLLHNKLPSEKIIKGHKKEIKKINNITGEIIKKYPSTVAVSADVVNNITYGELRTLLKTGKAKNDVRFEYA